jgi:hypothetical protein
VKTCRRNTAVSGSTHGGAPGETRSIATAVRPGCVGLISAAGISKTPAYFAATHGLFVARALLGSMGVVTICSVPENAASGFWRAAGKNALSWLFWCERPEAVARVGIPSLLDPPSASHAARCVARQGVRS